MTKHSVVALSEVLAKELELVGARVAVSVLCPGFVKTNIATSDRNRPPEHRGAPPPPVAAGLAQAMQQMVAAGQPPDAVAERVVAAIRERRFYVLTHPELKPAIEHRMRDILEERQPGVDREIRKMFGG